LNIRVTSEVRDLFDQQAKAIGKSQGSLFSDLFEQYQRKIPGRRSEIEVFEQQMNNLVTMYSASLVMADTAQNTARDDVKEQLDTLQSKLQTSNAMLQTVEKAYHAEIAHSENRRRR